MLRTLAEIDPNVTTVEDGGDESNEGLSNQPINDDD